MKRVLVIMFVMILSASIGMAQDEMKGSAVEMMGSEHDMDGSGDPEQEAMMAKWREYATPGEAHKILNAIVGSWDYTMKHWKDAAAPAEESTGSSESSWIMDGRFVEEKVTGTAMGQPFNGVSIVGYNNGSKKYSSYWFDNMATGSMFSEGTYDAATKTISNAGTFFCPLRGETAYRSALKITDDQSHSYEMYMTEADGTEFLAMRIDYTRKP